MYRCLLIRTAMTFAMVVQDEVRLHFTTSKQCIIRNNIETKEVEQGLGKENVFEIQVSAVELSDIDTILACIYKSPDSDFYKFLHKLELLILKSFFRRKTFNSLW